GAAALSEGCFEVMLDRRLARDDGRGMGEGVLDNIKTEISLWLLIEDAADSAVYPHESLTAHLLLQMLNHPLIISNSEQSSVHEYSSAFITHLQPLESLNVPINIDVLSLRPYTVEDPNNNKLVLQLWN